jgi:hypothetical protein
MIFYEATADQAPAWFVMYANFSGFPAREFSGLNIQLELPHIVYLLPKESWKRPDVRVAGVALERANGRLSLVVENTGTKFGRVSSLQVAGAHRRITLPGFPLFPGGRRRVELPWDAADLPESVEVKTREFSFAHPVTIADP